MVNVFVIFLHLNGSVGLDLACAMSWYAQQIISEEVSSPDVFTPLPHTHTQTDHIYSVL